MNRCSFRNSKIHTLVLATTRLRAEVGDDTATNRPPELGIRAIVFLNLGNDLAS